MPSGDGQPRTFSIASDTASGAFNSDMLVTEIEADAGITTALNRVHTDGDVLDTHFAAALSAGEITALDAVVAAHSGTATTAAFQMWESGGVVSTELETWDNKMSRTAPALKAGTYRVMWYWEMRLVAAGAVNSKAAARFNFDGGSPEGIHHTIETDWQTVSGWDRRLNVAEGAAPTFTIDIRRDPTIGGDDAVEIRRMKMSFELVE